MHWTRFGTYLYTSSTSSIPHFLVKGREEGLGAGAGAGGGISVLMTKWTMDHVVTLGVSATRSTRHESTKGLLT